MSRIKSNTLPHSLYRQLKDAAAKQDRRVAELEYALETAHELKAQNVVSLTAALDKARADLSSVQHRLDSLLGQHHSLLSYNGRLVVEAGSYREQVQHLSKRRKQWEVATWLLVGVLVCTALVGVAAPHPV